MSELIGPIADETPHSVTYTYRGDEVIHGLEDMSMADPEVAHPTDALSVYQDRIEQLSSYLEGREVRILRPDGTVEILQAAEEIVPLCDGVDEEYERTVSRLFRKMTGNPEHKAPTLDPRLVYASYVTLRAGGSVIIPTFVGNTIGAASPRGLSMLYALKERPHSKAGVVFTNIDDIGELAEIPPGWEDYLRYMHEQGVRIGSKLLRNAQHPMFQNQDEWLRAHSSQPDGTSIFLFLSGPYPDAISRSLAADGILLTGSSANKSTTSNTRDFTKLHHHIRRGVDFPVWAPNAGKTYVLDEEHESQGIMVDFMPDEEGNPKLDVIRPGFLNGPFFTHTFHYLAEHPELGVDRPALVVPDAKPGLRLVA